MNLANWTARISNWKKTGNTDRPLEYHIAHLHEEVSEVFKAKRELEEHLEEMQKQGVNPWAQIWFSAKGDRTDHPEGFGIELADVILVALHIADVCGIDIEAQMEVKQTYNEGKRSK